MFFHRKPTRFAIRIVLTLLMAHLPAFSAGQEIVHLHYSTENGLANNAISNIMQDRRGFVWLATWDGLSRFDGYRFVNYRTMAEARGPQLHNRISMLLEDSLGNIWAHMYDEKLFRFNRRSERFESLAEAIPNGDNYRIKSILETSCGDIWAITYQQCVLRISTDRTTGRFSVKPFPVSAPTISVLCEDARSNVWVGTGQGAVLLSSSRNGNPVARELSLGESNITAICSSGDFVWFGSDNGRIFCYNGKNGTYTESPRIAHSTVTSLVVPKNGAYLYIGTAQDGCWQQNLRTSVRRRLPSAGHNVKRIFADSHNLIWIHTEKPGITKFDPSGNRLKTFVHDVTVPEYHHGTNNITERNGVVWAALTGGGFGYYDRKSDTFEYFHNNPRSASFSNVVGSFYIDPSNVVWMSTHERGLDRIAVQSSQVSRVFVEPRQKRISDNEFRAFLLDHEQRLWAATKSGNLYQLDSALQVKKRITCDDTGKPLGYIYSILQDKEGAFWLGTKGNGLFRMTVGAKGSLAFDHFKRNPSDPHSLGNDMIYSLLEDKDGRLWIATYGGGINLLERSGEQFRFLTPENGLIGYPQNSCLKIRALCQDAEGRIWAGTTEGAVRFAFDPAKRELHSQVFHKNSGEDRPISSDDIISLYSDSGGEVWLATVGGGVVRYTPDQSGKPGFKTYKTENGLPSNDALSITKDHKGNIWFATEHNICSLDPRRDILSVLSGYEGVGTTMLSEAAALALDDNRIIFGTLNGIYLVNTALLAEVPTDGLRLEITGFQLNDRFISPQDGSVLETAISESTSIVLPDRHVVFGFSYASLNYTLQHRVHYQYMLDGYDKTWHNDLAERKALYADIPHGNYRFRVRAFLPEAPDSYEERTLGVEIRPFIWETRSALIVYLLIIVFIIGFFLWIIRRKRLLIQGMRVFKIGPSEIILNNSGDQKFMTSIMEWLEKNYADPEILIDKMVLPSGMSRSSFYNRLKLLTQMSPVELLNDFRLKKAEMYLKDSNLSISEIAYRVGFNDPAYFARIFKARHGETPSSYRKNTSKHYQEAD